MFLLGNLVICENSRNSSGKWFLFIYFFKPQAKACMKPWSQDSVLIIKYKEACGYYASLKYSSDPPCLTFQFCQWRRAVWHWFYRFFVLICDVEVKVPIDFVSAWSLFFSLLRFFLSKQASPLPHCWINWKRQDGRILFLLDFRSLWIII